MFPSLSDFKVKTLLAYICNYIDIEKERSA